MNRFMKAALIEAFEGIKKSEGGPFGAVIVRKGKIIAKAHNRVILTNDPTAHAEIVAIRMAATKLKRFDLSDCVLYTSAEPCPMCFAAVHWAKIKKVYYGCTAKDAAAIGFDDEFIYNTIRGKVKKKHVAMKQLDRGQCLGPFRLWRMKEDKVRY